MMRDICMSMKNATQLQLKINPCHESLTSSILIFRASSGESEVINFC